MDLLGTDFPYASNALQGKHALVCGASKGIGRATAMMMAKAGANVTVCARNAASLSDLCDELSSLGEGEHASLVLDLEDQAAIQSSIPVLLSQRGAVHNGMSLPIRIGHSGVASINDLLQHRSIAPDVPPTRLQNAVLDK